MVTRADKSTGDILNTARAMLQAHRMQIEREEKMLSYCIVMRQRIDDAIREATDREAQALRQLDRLSELWAQLVSRSTNT